MDFLTFLAGAGSADFWQQHKNFCFTSSTYPLSWFGKLFGYLDEKKLLAAPYQRIFMDTTEKRALTATLSQSILGSFSFFWLGNLSEEKESKAQQELIRLLLGYQGPHSIAYFLDSSSKLISPQALQKTTNINLPADITFQQLNKMLIFFGISLDAKKTTFFKHIFSQTQSIDLETCCRLIDYLELINAKYLDEYHQFLTQLVGIPTTLSSLAEHFFAKNSAHFFAAWGAVSKDYPEIFWISFWAEQVWKAHHVVQYLTEKNFVSAKRMSFRLPYAFMNRDWQKSNTKELAQAYEFLYHMDYALKTGSTFCSLELFYMNYFNGKFA